MSQLPKPQDKPFEHFGDVLRHYRETISDRLRPYSPGLAPIQASAADLIRCMRSHGYSISAATYSAIENGESLPRDTEEFLDNVSKCLAIEHGSLEWWTLTLYAMHGLMSQKLGRESADTVISLSEDNIRHVLQESKRDKKPK
jgi:hypothetical protein